MKTLNRKQALKGVAAATLMMATASCSTKEESADDASSVEFLLVQNAEGVILKNGQLTLKNVAASTLYFSDRPDRIVGRTTTKEYVEHWAVGDNNFAGDPPNAVISILGGPKPEDIVVVLKEPRLEGADLIYTVEVLDGNASAEAGAVALFIDVVGRPLTPLSVAGVHRRTRRRVVRAVT